MSQQNHALVNEYLEVTGKSIPSDSIDYFNFYAENAFEIISDLPKEKIASAPPLSELKYWNGSPVKLDNLSNLNPLLVNLPRNNYYYAPRYVINSETGDVIMFRSQHILDIHFQGYKKQK